MLRRAMRSLFFLLWTVFWSFLLLELGARVYFSAQLGPDVLLWGTKWHRTQQQQRYMRGQNVFEHDNTQIGYSKYHPNQKRTDVAPNGVAFNVTINNKGFRGADHTIEKPPGTLRVLTLGASSTFGFGNRDNETYPVLLEELLNERLDGTVCGRYSRAEVINLGIPHLNSAQIAELFLAEGLSYQPDAITLYSGYNNTLGLGQAASLKVWSRHLLAINFIRVAREQNQRASQALLDQETEPRSKDFIAGLDKILATARRHNIKILPMTQQVRAIPAEVIQQQVISYDREMEILADKLKIQGDLSLLEGKVLIHGSLSGVLRRWAEDNDLELIDMIDLLDEHRYLLTSYVHLAPLANQVMAFALADELITQFECRLTGKTHGGVEVTETDVILQLKRTD